MSNPNPWDALFDTPEQKKPTPAAARRRNAACMSDLAGYVEHFRHRVLQDAMNEATASYWLRRAAQFSGVGNVRCDEIAQACRARADVSLIQGGDAGPDLAALLDEVA